MTALRHASAPNSRHGLAFAAGATALLAILAPEAADMTRQWTYSSSYHHGWLAAPIALWLVLDARDWRGVPLRFDGAGLFIVAAALAMALFGRAIEAAIVGHLSIVAGIAGAAVTTLGRAFVRRSAFAFGFLLFMVPFGESLVPALQSVAAAVVAGLLNLSGIETARDGVLLMTAAGRFEMAQSCAGLRFLLAGAMIASLAAHLAFRDRRRQALFVAAALMLALAANWLRAYAIVLAATITNLRIGTGPEHVAFGWILYLCVILALLAAARSFGDAARPAAMVRPAAAVE